jgi:hypothetical protein
MPRPHPLRQTAHLSANPGQGMGGVMGLDGGLGRGGRSAHTLLIAENHLHHRSSFTKHNSILSESKSNGSSHVIAQIGIANFPGQESSAFSAESAGEALGVR